MKGNVYRSAVNGLRFSEDLEQNVRKKAEKKYPWHRVARIAAVAAIVCFMVGTTVFAAEQNVRQFLRLREEGRIRDSYSAAKIMEFTVSKNLDGIKVYQMELKPKGYYHFGEGMIYHPTEGFLKVTDEYQLEMLDDSSLDICLEKNGRVYKCNMAYVKADGGIYSNLLEFYPVTNGEILVNMTAEGSHAWPVYVNLQTGVVRDALPGLDEADFLPEKLESGYEARIAYTQPFREGILVSSLVTGVRNGNTDSKTLHYWVREDGREAVKLDIPRNSVDYVIEDAFYYQDSDGICYVMDDNFHFSEIGYNVKTTDNLNCGLITACSPDGALEIVDVMDPVIYFIPEVGVEDNSLWDTTGLNATRNSPDGKIIVTHSYNDYKESNRPLDSISYLDISEGELCRVYIDADCRIQTHGWLDDDRYCVIYEDGLKRYLSVYEFR